MGLVMVSALGSVSTCHEVSRIAQSSKILNGHSHSIKSQLDSIPEVKSKLDSSLCYSSFLISKCHLLAFSGHFWAFLGVRGVTIWFKLHLGPLDMEYLVILLWDQFHTWNFSGRDH